MKKILSLVLVLVLVLGSMPLAFADEATPTAGETLQAYGLVTGMDAEGNLGEDVQVTRAMMIKLLETLLGEEEAASTFALPSTFTDVPADAWYAPYVAYAELMGYTNGMGDGTFAPDALVSKQMVAAYMLRGLGYEGTWATAEADALALGIDVAPAAAEMTRGEAFDMMLDALAVPTKDSEVTLGAKLEIADFITPEVVVPETLEVVSVNVISLAEVEVIFNQEVDATLAEDVGNYTFDAGHTIASATLAEDAKTVVLNLVGDELVQQEEFTLAIADVATAADTEAVMADYETGTMTAFDATIPTIVGVELTGPTTFDITFSEPVYDDTFSVLVNNGAYGVVTAPLVAGSTTHTVTLAAELAEGDYTIDVSGVEDAAGFAALDKQFTLTYVKDATLPTVSVVSATQKEVVVEFSKEVNDVTKLNFYHTFSAWNPDTITNNGDNTYTLAFDTYTIPAGTTNLVVLVNDGTNDITDNWSNVMAADATLSITVTADLTKPEVSKVEFIDESTVEITFSEDVPATTSEDEDNYVIKTAASGTVDETTFTATYDAADPFVVTLAFADPLATGAYTVTVSGIKDNALTQNEMDEFVGTFTVTDATPPTITSAISVDTASGTPEYIYVTFSEVMNVDEVLDVNNYEWGTNFAGKTALPDDTVITIFGDASKVRIELPDTTGFENQLYIAQVSDAIGNSVAALLTEVSIDADVAPAITAINTTSLNTIEITLDKELSAVAASNIVIDADGAGGGTAVAAASFANNATDGESVITVTLAATDVLANEGEVPTTVEITNAGGIETITGTVALAIADALTDGDPVTGGNQPVVATDGIAPVLSTIETADVDADGNIDSIILTYTEAIEDDYITPATYTVDGYEVTAATSGDSVNVVLTLTDDVAGTDATPEVVQVLDIRDIALNILAAADYDVADVDTTDAAGAQVISAVASDDPLTDATTITVTFSEAIDFAAMVTATTIADEDAITVTELDTIFNVDTDGDLTAALETWDGTTEAIAADFSVDGITLVITITTIGDVGVAIDDYIVATNLVLDAAGNASANLTTDTDVTDIAAQIQ